MMPPLNFWTRIWYEPARVSDADRPAIKPSVTVTVPTPKGRFTDARGFTGVLMDTPPETLRLPCPETEQMSLTPSSRRSAIPAGITKPDSVAEVAAKSVGAAGLVGKAFQYSNVMS